MLKFTLGGKKIVFFEMPSKRQTVRIFTYNIVKLLAKT